MLNRIAFVSALTEGLTTVIPLHEEEIIAAYDIVTDYLQENFPGFTTELQEVDDTTSIRVFQNHEFAYSIQFVDNKVFILNDDNFNPTTDLAGSLYGILMIMSTYLIVRLNSFSFTSKEISEDVYEASAYTEREYLVSDEKTSDSESEETNLQDENQNESQEEDQEKEEESSFDDEWI